MPWGWILCALLVPVGLLLLAAALFHVRVRASWGGAWESLDSRQEGFFRIEYGFPGFMREWDWSEEEAEDVKDGGRGEAPHAHPPPYGHPPPPPLHPNATRDEEGEGGVDPSPSTFPGAGGEELPPVPNPPPRSRRTRRDRNRWRRALFRLVTDGKTWKLLARHGERTARGALALLRPRVAIAVGHPDPMKLARLAGYWHASAPLLPASRATLELRFQDPRPTLAVRAEGGFSALSFVLFGIRNASSFPWIGIGRRVWHSWWRHELEGWRKWAYERLQD